MAIVQDLFQDRSKRPEPEIVSGITTEEIIETVIENPQILDACSSKEARERVDRILRSKTYTIELPNLLPYIEELVIKIMKQYGERSILFAARDADVLYDALRTTLGNSGDKDKVFRLPGSHDLIRRARVALDYSQSRDKVRNFLSRYGVNEEEIMGGRKYLLVDTGFRGTVGYELREIVKNLFGGSLLSREESVEIGLSSLDSRAYYGAKELKTFIIPPRTSQEKFPKTIASLSGCFPLPHYFTDNFYLAVALQLLPKFHGAYKDLTSEGEPLIWASWVDSDIDYVQEDVNASIVDPVAALLVQVEVVKYFQQRRDEVLGNVSVRQNKQ